MSEQKHTEELVVKGGKRLGICRTGHVSAIVISNGKTQIDVTNDNAARLVDCYEALEGVDDVDRFIEDLRLLLEEAQDRFDQYESLPPHRAPPLIYQMSWKIKQALALLTKPKPNERTD